MKLISIAALALIGTAVTMKIGMKAREGECQISKFDVYSDVHCKQLITVNSTTPETNFTMVQQHVSSWEDAIKQYQACTRQDDHTFTKITCDDKGIVSKQYTDELCQTPQMKDDKAVENSMKLQNCYKMGNNSFMVYK